MTEQAKAADAAVRTQFAHAVGPFSPFWRERLRALGISAGQVGDAAALRRLPAVGERDVCPDGDPAGAARLVLQADEAGWALHTSGPELRRGISSRLRGAGGAQDYRRQVEAAVRPTSYLLGGLGLTLPLASTRGDLDLMARAGARLWGVLGLGAADVLVSALPVEQRVEHVGLAAAALGAGAPALFPGDEPAAVEEALRLLPVTVLALPALDAAEVLAELGEVPGSVRTVLLVGGPSGQVRREVALAVPGRRVLGVWGPADGRVLYGESRSGEGYVTYPDLEVLDLVDPDTGEPVSERDGGEVVLTQLLFRGSALVRWRTGTFVDEPLRRGAAADGRTVPRIPSALAPGALVPVVRLHGRERAVDLRAVSSALVSRRDLAAFRVDLGPRGRDGKVQLVLRVALSAGAPASTAVEVSRAVRAAAGVPVSQVVLDDELVG